MLQCNGAQTVTIRSYWENSRQILQNKYPLRRDKLLQMERGSRLLVVVNKELD